MKHFNDTITYLFKLNRGKKFLIFFLFALLPCAFVAYFLPLGKYLDYFIYFSPSVFKSFGDIWSFIVPVNFYSYLGIVCSMLLLGISVASITSIITRTLRVGDLSVPRLFYSVNEYIIPSLSMIFILALIYVIFHTVFAMLMNLWLHLKIVALGLALTSITFAIMIGLVLYLYSALLIWLPIMSFTGFRSFKALGLSVYKSRSDKLRFFTAILLPLAIMLTFCVGAYFVQKIWALSWFLTTVGYALFVSLIIPYKFIAYCNIESITRADLSQYPYLRR